MVGKKKIHTYPGAHKRKNMMNTSDKRELILNTVEDLVSSFLYYDRKDDEDLPMNVIETAIQNGEITIEEIVDRFKFHLLRDY